MTNQTKLFKEIQDYLSQYIESTNKKLSYNNKEYYCYIPSYYNQQDFLDTFIQLIREGSQIPTQVTFRDFFIGNTQAPKSIVQACEELNRLQPKKNLNIPPRDNLIFINKDNGSGRCVTIEALYKMLENIDYNREKYEERAVINESDGTIFFNASAACRHLEVDPKSADRLYQSIESRGSFYGEYFVYATREDILVWIKSLED